jgi:Bbp16-like protein
MLLDTQAQLDNAHAYTATAVSTNVYDTGPIADNAARDISAEGELRLTILITTTVTTNVSTVFTLESATDTGLTTGAVVHWTGPTVLVATLVGGYFYALGVPLPPGAYKRYVGIRMTPSTSWGAGAASAWLHHGLFTTTVYASRVTNSY